MALLLQRSDQIKFLGGRHSAEHCVSAGGVIKFLRRFQRGSVHAPVIFFQACTLSDAGNGLYVIAGNNFQFYSLLFKIFQSSAGFLTDSIPQNQQPHGGKGGGKPFLTEGGFRMCQKEHPATFRNGGKFFFHLRRHIWQNKLRCSHNIGSAISKEGAGPLLFRRKGNDFGSFLNSLLPAKACFHSPKSGVVICEDAGESSQSFFHFLL